MRAAAHRQDILDAIEAGTFEFAVTFPKSRRSKDPEHQTLTVASHLKKWLQDERPYLKASTYKNYVLIIHNRLIPALGDIRLEELTRREVKAFTRTLTASSKTIGNLISPLRVALDAAVEDDLLETNPLDGWKIKRKKGSHRKKDQVDPLSAAEREAILAVLEGQCRNLVQFVIWTGLRTSELVALDWSDIDWERGTVSITKGLTMAAREAEEPKTLAGEREVKLLSPALEALQAQKGYTFEKGKEIFQNPQTKARWKGDQPIRRTLWIPALQKAGVRYRKPYITRHTYASMLLTAGEPVQWVASQMGHTNWAFTARVYARFITDDMPEAGAKAEAAYPSAAITRANK